MPSLTKLLVGISLLSGLTFNSLIRLSAQDLERRIHQKTEKIQNGFIEYNKQGQMTRKVLNNGIKTEIKYEYNDKGLIEIENYFYNLNKDDKNDSTETWTYEYDKQGRKIQERIEVTGRKNRMEIREYKYKGNKRKKITISYDDNDDGKIDNIEEF